MIRPVLILLIFLVIVGLIACSSFKLDEPLRFGADDWLMGGGSPLRAHQMNGVSVFSFEPAWEYNAGGGFPRNAMIRAGEHLFVSTLHGEVHIINIRTGDRLGRIHFGESINGSPLLYENVLIVPLSSGRKSLIAYDLLKGKELWSRDIGPVETSPVILDSTVYVAARDGTLYALDPLSGESVWSQSFEGPCYASPGGRERTVFVGSARGVLSAINADDGSVLWKTDNLGTILTHPVLDDGHIYITTRDSMVYSVFQETGEIRWKQKKDARFYAAPALGKEYILVGTAGGSLLALDRKTGETRWEYRAKSVINSEPLAFGSYISFVSLDNSVYVIREGDGVLKWSYTTDSRLKTTPLIWGRHLVICAEDRKVYAFAAEGG